MIDRVAWETALLPNFRQLRLATGCDLCVKLHDYEKLDVRNSRGELCAIAYKAEYSLGNRFHITQLSFNFYSSLSSALASYTKCHSTRIACNTYQFPVSAFFASVN